jgi:hypothetical protein
MKCREYQLEIAFNGIEINRVIIDAHYEKKHSSSITDEIILDLVKQLHGRVVLPDEEKPPYSYFIQDRMELNGKFYRLIWLAENHELYIGVVNAHRRS